MALRGEALHRHILDTAKLVFLELGYARTTMDTVASRAATSKRTLYAHFPTKEILFHASVERSQQLYEWQLGEPREYSDDPREAVVRYCGRALQMMTYTPIVQLCRLGMAEAQHLPDAATAIHSSFLGITSEHLADHLRRHHTADECEELLAETILGATVYPFLIRALFGLEPLHDTVPSPETLDRDVDLEPIRRLADRIIPAAEQRRAAAT